MGTNIYAKYFHFCKKLSFVTQLEAHYYWAASLSKKSRNDPSAVHHSCDHWALLKKKKKKRICGGICLPCQQLPRLCLITHLYRWDRFKCDVHIFRFSLTTECNKSISPIPHIQVLKQKVSKLEKNKKQLLE